MVRDRLDWKETSDFYQTDSPIARGNQFNQMAEKTTSYPYHEVNLSNGKRLDSYDTSMGEIISMKASRIYQTIL